MKKISFGLVGAGRVGLAFIHHATTCGLRFAWGVDPRYDGTFSSDHGKIFRSLEILPDIPVDICVIAVEDDNIAAAARELTARSILQPGTIVFHTSGVNPSSLLQPLADAGMITGSLHPIQSFSDIGGMTPLHNIGCGIEGSDDFYASACLLADQLGWQHLRIRSDHKALYHAACVFAGNFPTVIASIAATLLHNATDRQYENVISYLLPMMEEILDRLHSTTPQSSLTGPAARGQSSVVNKHFTLLQSIDGLSAEVYRVLSYAAAELAGSTPFEPLTLVTQQNAASHNKS